MSKTPRSKVACTLVIASLMGCAPGQFDDLARRQGKLDAGHHESDAAADANGDEPDANGDEDAAAEDAGMLDDAGCPIGAAPRPLKAPAKAIELARLQHPASVHYRILGPTAYLGSERVWAFSSTSLKPGNTAPKSTPLNYPSAARDGAMLPWVMQQPNPAWKLDDGLIAGGLPEPLLALEANEDAGDALTVMSMIRTPPVLGGIAFVRKTVGFGVPKEMWTAQIEDGATRGMRLAQPLFKPPDPLFGVAAHRGGSFVKLFACSSVTGKDGEPPTFPCTVARVPVESALDRSAYEAYTRASDGSWSWSKDLTLATPVMYGSDSAMSLGWNAWLGKFLVAHSKYFSNVLALQAAPAVEGPWEELTEVDLGAAPVWTNSQGREHPGLQTNCGKRIIVSHWSPTGMSADGFPNAGDTVLSAIDLE